MSWKATKIEHKNLIRSHTQKSRNDYFHQENEKANRSDIKQRNPYRKHRHHTHEMIKRLWRNDRKEWDRTIAILIEKAESLLELRDLIICQLISHFSLANSSFFLISGLYIFLKMKMREDSCMGWALSVLVFVGKQVSVVNQQNLLKQTMRKGQAEVICNQWGR